MAEVSAPMADHEGTFDSEFFKEWESILNEDQPSTMSLRKKTKPNSRPPSRLVGESEEQRDRRLRLARECSLRRRSMETPEEREKRLHEQRTRMALKRKNESEEEREARRKKAREREKERRRSETGEKRELRLKYSRERASLRREKETPEDRQKRLEISRARAAERRKQKKLHEESGESSADPPSISNTPNSVTAAKPRAKKRSSRPRSVTRRKQKPEDDRPSSPVIEYSMTDNGIPLEEYKVCRDFSSKREAASGSSGNSSNNGGDAGSAAIGVGVSNGNTNGNSNGYTTDSMVGVVSDRQMISDVPDMAGRHAQTSVTSLPSTLEAASGSHHPATLDAADHGMTMILTPNPFHHSEASAFQPPPPQAVVHPPPHSMATFAGLQGGAGVIGGGGVGVVKGGGGLVGGAANVAGMVGNPPGGRVGDDILEGMGYLEHRFQLHPDFTLREQQNRGYNIQAVVLRNS